MALELGPCDVLYGTAGSEVSLGKTNGGVSLTIKDDSVDLVSDQNGSSAEDTIITGTTVEVSMALAEITMEKLNQILQPNVAVPSDNFAAGENKVGLSLLANSKSLLLKKYVNGAVSELPENWVTFPAAAPVGDVEMSYDASNQRVLNATFKCFPKDVTANWDSSSPTTKNVAYFFGDETQTS